MVLQMLLMNILITITLYASIKYYGTLDTFAFLSLPGLGVPCSAVAIITYPNAAVLQFYSEKFRRFFRKKIESCKYLTRQEKKELNYYVTVSRDIVVSFGSFYNYNKSTIFTFFDIIVRNTIDLRLAFP